ncbi:MAG: corrinoid protein [Methanomassiliicoccales archaeon]|jgi:methanogenic corrinoid protein MtbC1|nr:corrinoid protein [Methanomassiliicoccales archaeon]
MRGIEVKTGGFPLIYDEIAKAMVEGDGNKVVNLVDVALNKENKPPSEIIKNGLARGMDILGRLYESGERYLVDLIVASDSFRRSLEILRPRLIESGSSEKLRGVVILGTVEGDIHEIGKKLVGIALEVAGFRVIDLGPDVPPDRFSNEAKNLRADILGMSSLITTTMINAKRTIDKLVEDGIRGNIKIMVGGAPVDESFVRMIGGDAYGKDAFEAAAVAKKIICS